ncbi:head GIN domain-containing protein [Sphingomonas baiyangensis]|uniref:DUF2807 domain-containing protein n=1 Tax=Sphingomonas baiyangensis TaxID=2572576 RepID=A0A4U1L3V0_9SPHN|nr:head GIN domain-containing protein [Sphingomonas baiyangensis]TKD50873.1 DUF2807 domain-containing protein [Sphingomonas baiyangensis]
MRLLYSAIALAAALAACSGNAAPDSGPRETRAFQLSGFDKVDLRGADDVRVTTGGAFSVRAEAPREVLDALEIDVVDGILRVSRKRGEGWNWGSGNRGSALVSVTMPAATAASISGAGDLTLDRGSGDFAGTVSGSGDLAIGRIEGGNVRLSVSGSGDIAAAGNAANLNATVSGAGTIRAGELIARSGDVRVSGAGDIVARIDGNVDVRLSGVGSADLGPQSVCRTRKSGVGDVKCGRSV